MTFYLAWFEGHPNTLGTVQTESFKGAAIAHHRRASVQDGHWAEVRVMHDDRGPREGEADNGVRTFWVRHDKEGYRLKQTPCTRHGDLECTRCAASF